MPDILIDKSQHAVNSFRLSTPRGKEEDSYFYPAARDAMRDYLRVVAESHTEGPLCVLVPGYIGVSPKEGSGIYDPLKELEDKGLIRPIFYRMTANLTVDLLDVCQCIAKLDGDSYIFLRVNYFGFVDANSDRIYDVVHASNGLVLEDNAHGYFTYRHITRHNCDACFFSLHKQFPFESGGELRVLSHNVDESSLVGLSDPNPDENPFYYDFDAISDRCRDNFQTLDDLMSPYLSQWIPLRKLDDVVVPQTYPIALINTDRYQVYLDLNEQGFGVTSLYHTMIDPLRDNPRFEASGRLSGCVLNLPVHQDADKSYYPQLLSLLSDSCRRNQLKK